MITVHHLNNSRSQRILWLLEELEVEYDIRHYQRDSDTSRAPAELKAIHPMGKSPVITDGENVIAETGASDIKDMGKVMGNLKSQYAGQIDMGKAGGLVKSILG